MTPQQKVEVGFWRRCFVDEEGGDEKRYLERRERNFREDARPFWDEIFAEKGLGLDLGCGLVSTLGFKGTQIAAVDPLFGEYEKIFHAPTYERVNYFTESGEALHFCAAAFDYVWNINVIDHTPDPQKMIAEILRVLRPGGHLYFSVNFDPKLQDAHYAVWTRKTVEEHMAEFKLLRGVEQWRPEHGKYTFWGLYERPHVAA